MCHVNACRPTNYVVKSACKITLERCAQFKIPYGISFLTMQKKIDVLFER